uniref:FBD domain-containing protein n=1 Tax=Heterorhabditis bacteriophora TaxID=37862 RepID=A0A1I7WWZ0_HETBA
MLLIAMLEFNDGGKITIVDRLLSSTKVSYLCIMTHNTEECCFEKFFRSPSVRKVRLCLILKHLILEGFCDFSDDDLSAIHYRLLYLEQCCLSEDALRRLLEDIVDGRRNIFIYEFNLQNNIDVERLLKDLPKTERTAEGWWNLWNLEMKLCNPISKSIIVIVITTVCNPLSFSSYFAFINIV